MFGIQYFVLIDEIKKAINGERYRSDVKNSEKIDAGSFKISNERKYFNIIIANVVFSSDLEDLKKLIVNQVCEVKILRIRPDFKQETYYPSDWGLPYETPEPLIFKISPQKIEKKTTTPIYKTIPPNQLSGSFKNNNSEIIPLEPSLLHEDPEISFYQKQKKLSGGLNAVTIKDEYIIEKVVGVTYDNRQEIIKQMKVGDHVFLQREPENQHDENAICVMTQSGLHIGYINRINAASYAPTLDKIIEPIQGEVLSLNKGYELNSNYGLTIRFKIKPKLQLQ